MKNIDPWQGKALTLYDDILNAKRVSNLHHPILTRLRSRIAQAYGRYEQSQATLETLKPDHTLTQEEREALIDCYEDKTAPLSRMKRDVLMMLPREIGDRCPYCGIDSTGSVDDGSTGGWDHYLPRGTAQGFAEFSVYPSNLIPCCWKCNRCKGADWKTGTQRLFINFYSDIIDQSTPLIEAHITLVTDGADVEFKYAQQAYSAFFSHFKRHCEALELRQRYAIAGRAELALMRGRILQRARRPSAPRHDAHWFLEDLRDTAEADARLLGINHWKPTLYRAAAGSDDFVRFCLLSAQAVENAENGVAQRAAGGQGA